MGGGGNQKWSGYSEPAKITEPISGQPSAEKTEGGQIEGYDIGGIPDPQTSQGGKKGDKKEGGKSDKGKGADGEEKEKREPRRELTDKEKKAKELAEARRNTPEAKANREAKNKINKMSAKQRIDHFANKKMLDAHIKSEKGKFDKQWNKQHKSISDKQLRADFEKQYKGSPGSEEYKAFEKYRAEHQPSHGDREKAWNQKRAELAKKWGKGGKKEWMKKNAKRAENIRDKVVREEAWRSRNKPTATKTKTPKSPNPKMGKSSGSFRIDTKLKKEQTG